MLDDVQILTLGSLELKVLFTPGHAPGHVCFSLKAPVDNEQLGLLFGGDLLFKGGIGRTDLPQCDSADMEASLRTIFGIQQGLADDLSDETKPVALDADTVVLPGHGASTTIGHERETNPFILALL